MGPLEALLLGILQGLTEFLPVSSSGHIELGKLLLGMGEGESPLLFTIAVHAATALSTIFVFRRRIGILFRDLYHGGPEGGRAFALKILVSMVPIGIIGLLFEEEVEAFFSGRPILVGSMLLITALLLFMANQLTHGQKKVGYASAFTIGIAQALAVMPGISRSGATISTSLLLGIGRERAAEFSFLMVLPPILGITLLKSLELAEKGGGSNIALLPLVIGFATAFIAGVLACKWMIRIVANARLNAFAIYCSLIGLLSIGFGWWTLGG